MIRKVTKLNQIYINGVIDVSFLNNDIEKIETLDEFLQECAKENNIKLDWCQIDNDSDAYTLYCMIETKCNKEDWRKCWNKWISHKYITSAKDIDVEILKL